MLNYEELNHLLRHSHHEQNKVRDIDSFVEKQKNIIKNLEEKLEHHRALISPKNLKDRAKKIRIDNEKLENDFREVYDKFPVNIVPILEDGLYLETKNKGAILILRNKKHKDGCNIYKTTKLQPTSYNFEKETRKKLKNILSVASKKSLYKPDLSDFRFGVVGVDEPISMFTSAVNIPINYSNDYTVNKSFTSPVFYRYFYNKNLQRQGRTIPYNKYLGLISKNNIVCYHDFCNPDLREKFIISERKIHNYSMPFFFSVEYAFLEQPASVIVCKKDVQKPLIETQIKAGPSFRFGLFAYKNGIYDTSSTLTKLDCDNFNTVYKETLDTDFELIAENIIMNHVALNSLIECMASCDNLDNIIPRFLFNRLTHNPKNKKKIRNIIDILGIENINSITTEDITNIINMSKLI